MSPALSNTTTGLVGRLYEEIQMAPALSPIWLVSIETLELDIHEDSGRKDWTLKSNNLSNPSSCSGMVSESSSHVLSSLNFS